MDCTEREEWYETVLKRNRETHVTIRAFYTYMNTKTTVTGYISILFIFSSMLIFQTRVVGMGKVLQSINILKRTKMYIIF